MIIHQVKHYQQVYKASGQTLLEILSCYQYYNKKQRIAVKGIKIDENMYKQNELCNQKFQQSFEQKNLLMLFEILISKVMIYPNDFDIEIFIEDQENRGLDLVTKDFSFTQQKMGSLMCQKLFQRFPKIILTEYLQLLNKIISNEINLDIQTLDSVFTLTMYLQSEYDEDLFHEKINYDNILFYLYNKAQKSIIFARRFLILFNHLHQDIQIDKQKLQNMFFQFLKIDDEIVQFQTLDCMGKLTLYDMDVTLNYSELVSQIPGMIMNFLQKFSNPKLLFKIGFFLNNTLLKAQCNLTQNTLKSIQQLNMEEVIYKNPTVMKPIFRDVLKALILSSLQSEKLYLYELCKKFIQISLNTFSDEVDLEQIFKFWQITNKNLVAQYNIQDEEMINLFKKFLSSYQVELYQFSTNQKLLDLAQQFLNQLDRDKMQFIFEFYQKILGNMNHFKQDEQTFIKESFYSFNFDLINTENKKNIFNKSNYEFIFDILLNELTTNSQKNLEEKKKLINAFNALILSDFDYFWVKVQQVDFQQFLSQYILYSDLIEDSNFKKLKTIVLILILEKLPINLFCGNLQEIISKTLDSIYQENYQKNIAQKNPFERQEDSDDDSDDEDFFEEDDNQASDLQKDQQIKEQKNQYFFSQINLNQFLIQKFQVLQKGYQIKYKKP